MLKSVGRIRHGRSEVGIGLSSQYEPNSVEVPALEPEMPRNHHPLDLVSPLADLQDLLVAVKP